MNTIINKIHIHETFLTAISRRRNGNRNYHAAVYTFHIDNVLCAVSQFLPKMHEAGFLHRHSHIYMFLSLQMAALMSFFTKL